MTQEDQTIHPHIPELVNQLKKGEIDRRQFVQSAAVLGVSAAAAYAMVGAMPRKAHAQDKPKFGGNLRVSMNVKDVADPATFDWGEKGNVVRHVVEPLVQVDKNNVAQPHLAESWKASDDLKTWTFNLRKGVKWSNGDEFGSDDVIANFERWLDPATGSSNQGRFSAMTETVDTGEKDEDGNTALMWAARFGRANAMKDSGVRSCSGNASIGNRPWSSRSRSSNSEPGTCPRSTPSTEATKPG